MRGRRLLVAGTALVAVLAVLLALALAGDDPSTGGTEVADASSATQKAGASRFWMTGTQPVDEKGTLMRYSMEGVSSADGKDVTGVADYSDIVRIQGGDPGALDPGALHVKLRLDYPRVWMHWPLYREMDLKKPWITFDLAALAESQGVDASIIESTSNPRAYVDLLRTANDTEFEGWEDVRGVRTKRVSATLELEDYPSIVPDEDREAAARSIARLGAGDMTFKVKVWIGEDGLVRRLHARYRSAAAPGAKAVEVEETIEFFDFGQQVNVAPPPARRTQVVANDWLMQP